MQWRSKGAEWQIGRIARLGTRKGWHNGDENRKFGGITAKTGGDNDKMDEIRGHRASHNFWGRQNYRFYESTPQHQLFSSVQQLVE